MGGLYKKYVVTEGPEVNWKELAEDRENWKRMCLTEVLKGRNPMKQEELN